MSTQRATKYVKLAAVDPAQLTLKGFQTALAITEQSQPHQNPTEQPADPTTKTRNPDSLDAIAVQFKRWKVSEYDRRAASASDDLLVAWFNALRPMAQAFHEVEARLKGKA